MTRGSLLSSPARCAAVLNTTQLRLLPGRMAGLADRPALARRGALPPQAQAAPRSPGRLTRMAASKGATGPSPRPCTSQLPTSPDAMAITPLPSITARVNRSAWGDGGGGKGSSGRQTRCAGRVQRQRRAPPFSSDAACLCCSVRTRRFSQRSARALAPSRGSPAATRQSRAPCAPPRPRPQTH